MKKQLLSILMLLGAVGISGQGHMAKAPAQVNFANSSAQVSSIHPQQSSNIVNRAVSIWSDDFSNPATWSIDNDGQTGSIHGWNINTTSESWYANYDFDTGIMSTNGGNFAEIQNGDYNNSDQAIGVTYTLTTSTFIDVNTLTGGNNDVMLSFEQYGGLFNDSQSWQISTDGTNWTTVGDNNSKPTFIGNNPAALYANPEQVTVNISSEIAANPSTVWIRFVWTSRFPTDPGTNAWTTFGWYIDNVEILQTPQHDLSVLNATWKPSTASFVDKSYSMIPLDQVQPISFALEGGNIGALDQSGVTMSVDINSGLFNSTSTPATVLAGDTLLVNDTVGNSLNTFTPSALGTYIANYSITSGNTDDNPSDNIYVDSFQVTNYMYARDGLVRTGSWYEAGQGHAIGNLFEIFNDAVAYEIEIVVASNSQVGAEVLGELYVYDPVMGDFTYVGETGFYYLTASDIANGDPISLPLNSSVSMTAGELYRVVARTYGSGGANNDMVIATSGDVDYGYSFLYRDNDGAWYTIPTVPMVRLSFDCSNYLAGLAAPTASFVSGYSCGSGSCATEVDLSVNNGNYLEVFDANDNLVARDSVANVGSNVYTISGTYCPGETYSAVAKSRCDDNSAFVQIGDTLYFEIDTTAIGIPTTSSGGQGATDCSSNDGYVTYLFDISNVDDNASSLTFTWTGPTTGNTSFNASAGQGMWMAQATGLMMGTYTGTVSSTESNCPPEQFTFEVGTLSEIVVNPFSVTGNASTCVSTDGFINLQVSNAAGGDIDVSWTGPVSGSMSNVTSGSTTQIPNLSIGTYEVVGTLSSDPTCSSDTATFEIVSYTVSQEICVVTVDEATSSYNIVAWEKPADMTPIDSFYVYREITTNNYQKIGAVDGADLSEYHDFAANPNTTNYKYKIKVLDACGSIGDYGDYHNSIHLQTLGGGNFQWTPYEIENTSNQVGSFNFYRDDNGTGNFVSIATIPGGNTSFTDVDFATYPNAVYRVDVNWISGQVCNTSRANSYGSTRSNKQTVVGGGTSNIPVPLISASTQTPSAATIVNFTDVSLNTPISWSWLFPGGSPASSSLANPSVLYNTPGVYDVQLTVANAAGSADSLFAGYITVGGPDGIEGVEDITSLFLFPNPTNDNLNVSVGITDNQEVRFELMTLTGQLIETRKVTGSGTITTIFDMNEMPASMYMLRITTANGSITKAVVKE